MSETTNFKYSFIALVQDVLPKLENYRQKNVNKYWREMELEFTEYTKAERYKNRVRVVDCFIQPLQQFLVNIGASTSTTTTDQDEEEPRRENKTDIP